MARLTAKDAKPPAMSRITAFKRETAKRLRADETSAEKALWKAMRRVPPMAMHFRRQAVIGPYIADFACMRAHVLIEVDGPSHSQDDNIIKEARRTAFLEAEGFQILRFWNDEIYQNLDGVLDTIHYALGLKGLVETGAPPPHPAPPARPSPSRGG